MPLGLLCSIAVSSDESNDDWCQRVLRLSGALIRLEGLNVKVSAAAADSDPLRIGLRPKDYPLLWENN